MNHIGTPFDWQAMVALSLVGAAAAYLGRRWWPGLRGLLAPASAVTPSSAAGKGCGNDGAQAFAASCNTGDGSSGCGNCGHHATPAKDHRVHIVRRPSHTGYSQKD